MKIPFIDFDSVFGPSKSALHNAVDDVFKSRSLILGPHGSAFEEEFASFCGQSHCIGVGSGLDALTLSLAAMGIGSGDEVIVPSQTFVATWLAVSHVGAKPVEVDVKPGSTLIDPELIPSAITSRTRAVIPVHLFGQPADMAEINAIACRNNLLVLEDAAQAHGARYLGQRVGSLGAAAAFSFYPTKNLGAFGDGGAVVTDDPMIARNVRRLRNYGSEEKYIHSMRGYNSRLDELQAHILSSRLVNLENENNLRRHAAEIYTAELKGINGIELPVVYPEREHVYHLFVIEVLRRDKVAAAIRGRGIQTQVHYPKIPGDQRAYSLPSIRRTCIFGRQSAQRSLSLPFWPGITASDQNIVSSALIEELGRSQ